MRVGLSAKGIKRRSTKLWKWGLKHCMILQGTKLMKRLRWCSTLDGSRMIRWTGSVVAWWHVECGTGRGIYIINQCEELLLGVSRRVLQVGKKLRETVGRWCWSSEMGDVLHFESISLLTLSFVCI